MDLYLVSIFLLLSGIFLIIYESYRTSKYIKELENENKELQKLLNLPRHLQFKTINKAYNQKYKNAKK